MLYQNNPINPIVSPKPSNSHTPKTWKYEAEKANSDYFNGVVFLQDMAGFRKQSDGLRIHNNSEFLDKRHICKLTGVELLCS